MGGRWVGGRHSSHVTQETHYWGGWVGGCQGGCDVDTVLRLHKKVMDWDSSDPPCL